MMFGRSEGRNDGRKDIQMEEGSEGRKDGKPVRWKKSSFRGKKIQDYEKL